MRIPRIYHPFPIANQTSCILSEDATNHVGRVLRMNEGDAIILFDGSNHIFHATLQAVEKKQIIAKIHSSELDDRESPLHIHLGQVISRGDRMEFTIQKSVELGVKTNEERQDKKLQQWQKIAIAACEQCGRNEIPEIRPMMKLTDWCKEQGGMLKLNLHPRAQYTIRQLPNMPKEGVRLLIGSEGGLSPEEIRMTEAEGFTEVLLGKRVLRTETASLAAITALQVCFGDI